MTSSCLGHLVCVVHKISFPSSLEGYNVAFGEKNNVEANIHHLLGLNELQHFS